MRSATSVEARYKRAHLSAIRLQCVTVVDRRYGPIRAKTIQMTCNGLAYDP